MGEWSLSPHIVNIGTRWMSVVGFTPWPPYPCLCHESNPGHPALWSNQLNTEIYQIIVHTLKMVFKLKQMYTYDFKVCKSAGRINNVKFIVKSFPVIVLLPQRVYFLYRHILFQEFVYYSLSGNLAKELISP